MIELVPSVEIDLAGRARRALARGEDDGVCDLLGARHLAVLEVFLHTGSALGAELGGDLRRVDDGDRDVLLPDRAFEAMGEPANPPLGSGVDRRSGPGVLSGETPHEDQVAVRLL